MLPGDDPLAHRIGPFNPVRCTAALVGMGVPVLIAKSFALLRTGTEGLVHSATKDGADPEVAGEAADTALKLASELVYAGADILHRIAPLLDGDSLLRARKALDEAYARRDTEPESRIIVPGQN